MYITPEWVQAIASIATLGTAGAALKIALDGPRRSARFAEEYRALSKEADDRRAMRVGVFATLMRCRSQMLHVDAVTALNLVDVAFIDAPNVRESWRHFLVAAGAKPFNATALIERYHGIIHAIAREMKLSDSISLTDVQAAYYPEAFGTMDEAALADAEEKLARRTARVMSDNEGRATN